MWAKGKAIFFATYVGEEREEGEPINKFGSGGLILPVDEGCGFGR